MKDNDAPWPEWTPITTPWNDPGGADPDEYHVDCYRCQAAERTPNQADGTRAECIQWAYGHENDPDPTPPPPPNPIPPRPKGR
jgi:hypothetical protein